MRIMMKKKLLFVIVQLIFMALVFSCAEGKPERHTEQDAGTSYHRTARKMMVEGAPLDSVIAMELKAVEEVRRGSSAEDNVDVLQEMGYLYCRAGRYDLGADFLLEAVDSINRRTPEEIDSASAVYLFGNLANLYTRMRMTENALEANSRALAYNEGRPDVFAYDLWRMRATTFQHAGMSDSVLACYDRALTLAGKNEKQLAWGMLERLEFLLSRRGEFPDAEIMQAIREVESGDYARVGAGRSSTGIIMGDGRIVSGDIDGGIKLMEEALEEIRERKDPEMLQYAEKHLLHAYAKGGYSGKLARMFPEYDALCDTLMSREKINSVMTSEFRFRTREKDLETRMWKEREATARKIIVLQWLAIILAVLLASFSMITILRKLRHSRKSREIMHQRLLAMLGQQKEVNATIETLNRRIEELNAEIESRDDTANIRQLMAEMPSCLLSDTQESMFRRYFSQIYPRFIPDLRHEFPSLTDNDELIAMFIYMKHSSEEISLSLGISKQSVNKARYRLRKKFDLDKETDLDTFLTSRKG